MEQKQDNRYNNLSSYAEQLHEQNRKRIKYSGIVLILLPVILGLIRWITDSDKIVFLIIWIICMFVISAYLVSIEYLDLTVRKIASGAEEEVEEEAEAEEDAEEEAEEDTTEDTAEGGDA